MKQNLESGESAAVTSADKSKLSIAVQNIGIAPDEMLYSLVDAARVIGKSVSFVRREEKAGKVNFVYVGNTPRIRVGQIRRVYLSGLSEPKPKKIIPRKKAAPNSSADGQVTA